MMYPYKANGEGELTIEEGVEVSIIEPDGMAFEKESQGQSMLTHL
jgi:hypothetical protein